MQHQLVGVDAEVADVVAERAQSDAGVFVEVALAEFDEAAEWLQHPEVAVDGLARKRIEHHVDAAAFGFLEDLVGEGQTARVKDFLHTEQAQEIPFFLRARGGIDLGPAPLGNLNRRDADAAGSAMNQHFLALLQPRQMVQRVIGRKEGAGNGGRRFERQSGRDERQSAGARYQAVAKTRRRETDHGVARRKASGTGAHGQDHAGKFEPQAGTRKAALHGLIGQQAERVHDVAKIKSGGFDRHLDLILARRRSRIALPS